MAVDANTEFTPQARNSEWVRRPLERVVETAPEEIDEVSVREKFLPVTKAALFDRLTAGPLWPQGLHIEVRRLFRYLDYWRQQQYSVALLKLMDDYETFSPDTDLLVTRELNPEETRKLQKQVVGGVEHLLRRANYTQIDLAQVDLIITRESALKLDLSVDLDAFEELAMYYRGISQRKESRRNFLNFGRKEEFEVPIFRRLCVLFKLKSFEARVTEVMKQKGWAREDAEAHVKKLRAHLPDGIKEGNIYLKLFRNIPRSDIEIAFPNTQVKFRWSDKLRLGVTAGGGLGFGLFSSAGKIALLASNPIAAAGAAAGIGGIAFRQAMGFVNQRQRYMMVMAKNLYFLSMADNGSVITELTARGAEEDIKEEWLLYAIMAKERVTRADLPQVDEAIEHYLKNTFGIDVDFDISDALERLIADGLVTESPDGTFATLTPTAASRHIDDKWDVLLDNLPIPGHAPGLEQDGHGHNAGV